MKLNLYLPNKDKAFLCIPDFNLWNKIAFQNAKEREKWSFSIGPKSAREFKVSAAEEILKLAENFSKKWELGVLKKSPESFIFVAGHQPELFHPGAWIKNFLINKSAADKNIIGINFWVDTDEVFKDYIETPYFKKRLNKTKIFFNLNHQSKVYHKLPPPSKKFWNSFKKQVLSKIKTLQLPALRDNFCQYHKIATELIGKVSNLSEFIALSRRYYEKQENKSLNYLELPLSEVIKSKSFFNFFLDIVNKSKNFFEIYNKTLDEYRKRHKIRSLSQPFPNLRKFHNLLELPFWVITSASRRESLWVNPADKTCWCENKKILTLGATAEKDYKKLLESKYNFSFKAVTLTIFMRLFISDLFLHGVGGAKYDIVTDQIIQRFYNIQPPKFAMSSLTLYLPFDINFDINSHNFAEKSNLEKQLWLIKHNPQKLFSLENLETKPEIKNLLIQKEKLLVKMQTVSVEEKKSLAQNIKQINLKLEKELKPKELEIENKIHTLSEKTSEYTVATFREYPFCFFSPDEIRSII